MAVGLLAGAAMRLLARYGLKKGKGSVQKTLREKAVRQAKAKAKGNTPTKASIGRRERVLRAKQVAGNIVTDVSAGGLIASSIGDGIKLEEYENDKELMRYVKASKPDTWKRFSASPYTSLRKFIESEHP